MTPAMTRTIVESLARAQGVAPDELYSVGKYFQPHIVDARRVVARSLVFGFGLSVTEVQDAMNIKDHTSIRHLLYGRKGAVSSPAAREIMLDVAERHGASLDAILNTRLRDAAFLSARLDMVRYMLAGGMTIAQVAAAMKVPRRLARKWVSEVTAQQDR